MTNYKTIQLRRQLALLGGGASLYRGAKGGGLYKGRPNDHILVDMRKNLVDERAADYFERNTIHWHCAAANVLSSQVACLNHLFPLRQDARAVLAVVNGLRNFTRVLPVEEDGYVEFEAVSSVDYLNEGKTKRGMGCTSIDALMLAEDSEGKRCLIMIEWKYCETPSSENKSNKINLYANLIDSSTYLEHHPELYFREPYYQLMRQTLWGEQMVKHHERGADNFLHVIVVPRGNTSMRKHIEDWKNMLTRSESFIIADPVELLQPACELLYPDHADYLSARYGE